MKSLYTLIALLFVTGAFAQTKLIYGKFTKSDGSRIKGTSAMRNYEDQLIINSYTGGADNTASIEIEVPTYTYVADFRNMMNTAKPATAISKTTANTTVKPTNLPIASAPQKTINVQALQTFPIARVEISVTNRIGNNVPALTSQIILEDVQVENCTDNGSGGIAHIKLKASRIGWIYYQTDPQTGKLKSINKSGWDTVTASSWANF